MQDFENYRTSCRDYPKQNDTTNFMASVDPQPGQSADQGESQPPVTAVCFDADSPRVGFEGLTTSPFGDSLHMLLRLVLVQVGPKQGSKPLCPLPQARCRQFE